MYLSLLDEVIQQTQHVLHTYLSPHIHSMHVGNFSHLEAIPFSKKF